MSKKNEYKKLQIRIPISKIGVIKHKPKKGKGSYNRKQKHKKGDTDES